MIQSTLMRTWAWLQDERIYGRPHANPVIRINASGAAAVEVPLLAHGRPATLAPVLTASGRPPRKVHVAVFVHGFQVRAALSHPASTDGNSGRSSSISGPLLCSSRSLSDQRRSSSGRRQLSPPPRFPSLPPGCRASAPTCGWCATTCKWGSRGWRA